MKESDFQTEVGRSIGWLRKQIGLPIAFTKIPDPGGRGGAEARFIARRGYDCFLLLPGQHIALELKMAKSTAIGFDKLDDYQGDKLNEVVQAGHSAFVVVNFRVIFSKAEAKKRGVTKTISAFAVPVQWWYEWRIMDCRASIPLSKMEEEAIAIPKIQVEDGLIGWDLRPIVKTFGEKA